MLKKKFFLALSSLVFALSVSAEEIESIPVELPACPANGTGMYTVNINGAQFPQPGWGGGDGCKYAVRWHGDDAVDRFYKGDLSRYTGLFDSMQKPPSRRHQVVYQRGPEPKSEYPSSGVQFVENRAGFYLSSKSTPGRVVLGGGLNHWLVKSPNKGDSIPAFYFLDSNGEKRANNLSVQAEIAVTFFESHHMNLETRRPGAQVAFILSLKDRTHPELHEVVMVAATHDAFSGNVRPNPDGFVGCDFGRDADPAGLGGVHFTGTNFTPENIDPYSDVKDTKSYTQVVVPMDNRKAEAKSFQINYTIEKFRAFISMVNSLEAGGLCPKSGYSTNPDDYDISNVGIIAESLTFDERNDGSVGDMNRNHVSIGGWFTVPDLRRIVRK